MLVFFCLYAGERESPNSLRKKTSYLIKQRELNVIEFVIKLCERLILSTSLEILEEKLKKYTNTCRLGMRHDGLDLASSLHHTQGNGEQCV